MAHKNHIVFIGGYRFPAGDAAAIRTLSLARICRDLGYKVTVIGKGVTCREHYDPASDAYVIEGVRYLTMNPRPVSQSERVLHPLRRRTLYTRTLDRIGLGDVHAVVVYATNSAIHIPGLAALCRRHAVPLVADLTEWYPPRRFRLGRLDPSYVVFSWCFHLVLPRLRNLIVISRLLEQRFKKRVGRVIRVPPVVDPHEMSAIDETGDGRLVLLYAGAAGNKDHLIEIFQALARLSPLDRGRFDVRIIGSVQTELIRWVTRAVDAKEWAGASVLLIGQLDHREVLDYLRRAHFTVLLRPNERYANAGFPSKVPESLAAGVPMILTYTSDLREYLGDGLASIEVSACTPEAVHDVLKYILTLSPTQLSALRAGARAKAEQHFDYRHYLPVMRTFLDQVE